MIGSVVLFFFIEHFIGVGPLGWLLPLTTAGAAWGIWRNYPMLRTSWGAEAAFLAGFGYTLLWRLLIPRS